MTQYTDLRKSAEAATPWGSYKWRFFRVNPATILALLDEREKLLKVVGAARSQFKMSNALYDALKELDK